MAAKVKKENIINVEEEEHRAYHRKLAYVFILMLILLFGSATFYNYVEKWRYLDAVYFSTATMTTIGYGDITPRTDAGKIFTIFFAFSGVGIVLYGLSLMASHFVEAREEFWLQRFGRIKIMKHTETFWEKIKKLGNYNPDEITKEYENSVNRKK